MSSAAWWRFSIVASAAAAAVFFLQPSASAGTGARLWLGVGAGALVVFASSLGLRKRFLRLRVGRVASWRSAHDALGFVALVMALLHCDFEASGTLAAALLASLITCVLLGLVGVFIQATVPRLMTSRLSDETASGDVGASLLEDWRLIHELVVSACGPQPHAAAMLASAGLSVDGGDGAPSASDGDRAAIATFYSDTIIDFLRAPRRVHSPLGTEAGATLAFDALRATVSTGVHDQLGEIERLCEDARGRRQERTFHRVLSRWQIAHVAIGAVVLILTIAHAVAALYY